MRRNKNFSIKELKIKLIVVCSLLMVFVLSFFFAKDIEKFLGLSNTYAKNQVGSSVLADSKYEVSYIDVGQGSCAYVRLPDGKTVLIDGGNTIYGTKVANFLKTKNVSAIDYLIATHADADHIGGLLTVLREFDVKNIYRPFQISGTGTTAESFVASESEDLAEVYFDYVESTNNRSKISRVTSEVYADFIDLVYSECYFEDDKNIFSNIMVFYDGLKISGNNYEIEFFAPLIRDDYVDLSTVTKRTSGFATVGYGSNESNGNSAIFLLSIFEETFLFTGDAPWTSGGSKDANYEEIDFISSLTTEEKSDFANVSVYAVGHHGSSYSSSEELLSLINPSFAVISVASNNTYGHPASDVIERLAKTNCIEEDYLLRTDKFGTITFGEENGKLCYVIELESRDESLTISWYELSMIIFISVGFIVVFIKPKNYKRKFV